MLIQFGRFFGDAGSSGRQDLLKARWDCRGGSVGSVMEGGIGSLRLIS